MTCQKCSYEFCWICLGHYPGYQHTTFTACPLRGFIMYPYVWAFILVTIFKLCYSFSACASFFFAIGRGLGLLLGGNLSIAAGLVHLAFLDGYYHNRNYSVNINWGGIFTFIFPIAYFCYFWFIVLESPFLTLSLWVVVYEAIILGVGFGLYFILSKLGIYQKIVNRFKKNPPSYDYNAANGYNGINQYNQY